MTLFWKQKQINYCQGLGTGLEEGAFDYKGNTRHPCGDGTVYILTVLVDLTLTYNFDILYRSQYTHPYKRIQVKVGKY